VIPKPGISLSKRKRKPGPQGKKKGSIFSPHRASMDPNRKDLFGKFDDLSPSKKHLISEMQKLDELIEKEGKIT
jgi:hypothetical protein